MPMYLGTHHAPVLEQLLEAHHTLIDALLFPHRVSLPAPVKHGEGVLGVTLRKVFWEHCLFIPVRSQ